MSDLAAKSGNHAFHGAKGELVIDHSTRLLFNEDGKAVRISEAALPQMENAFDQIDKLDTFFSNLKSNGQYQRCLALGKHSNRRISLGILGKSAPIEVSGLVVPNSVRSTVIGSPIQGVRADVVEPGSCEDWANVLKDYQSQYDSQHTSYEAMVLEAIAAGATVDIGAVLLAGTHTMAAQLGM